MARARRKARPGNLRCDIRDARIPGGRLSVSLGTKDPREAVRREDSLRQLIDAGEWEILRRLRIPNRKPDALHIEAVHAAVRAGDLSPLRSRDDAAGDLTLGAEIDAMKQTKRATRTKGTQHSAGMIFGAMERHFGVERTEDGEIVRDVPLVPIGMDECAAFLHAPKSTNRDRPWSAGTQGVAKAYASQLWRVAIAREAERAEIHGLAPRLTRNPWDRVETARNRKGRVGWLRPQEWRTLARVTEGRPEAALLALGCLAGLRMSEALHLRPGIDVDMERRLIHVQPREGSYAWHPKTRNSIRHVPMGDQLHATLGQHFARGFSGERYLLRLSPRHDQPMNDHPARRLVEGAYRAAGIRYGRQSDDALTFHSLRHTFASWLIQADVLFDEQPPSLLTVARLLGDTVDMVVKVYGHLLAENFERAVKLLDGVQNPTTLPLINPAE
jgi:integrase